MAETWDVHTSKIDGVDISIAVNLALLPGPGDPDRPMLARVRYALRQPTESGLAGERECPILQQIKTRLNEVLSRLISAKAVGIVTRKSRLEHYFYTPADVDNERLSYAAHDAMQIYPAYPFEADVHQDTAWTFYRESLYPQAMTVQLVQNRRMLTEMKQNGDLLTVERPIFHWAIFHTDGERKLFIDGAIRLGFRLAENGLSTSTDPKRPFCVEVERTDPAVLNRIDTLTAELVRLARSTGGRYDGWETSIVRKTDRRL